MLRGKHVQPQSSRGVAGSAALSGTQSAHMPPLCEAGMRGLKETCGGWPDAALFSNCRFLMTGRSVPLRTVPICCEKRQARAASKSVGV